MVRRKLAKGSPVYHYLNALSTDGDMTVFDAVEKFPLCLYENPVVVFRVLESEGFVESERVEGRGNVYSITQSGRELLENVQP